MGNGPCFTSPYTRQGWVIRNRFAQPAGVFDFSTFRFFYGGYRNFPKGVVGVLIPNFKDAPRTGRNAVPAAVAFIRIKTDKEFTGTVFKTEISNHGKILVMSCGLRVMRCGLKRSWSSINP